MKSFTLPSRLNSFVANVWGILAREEQQDSGGCSRKETTRTVQNRPQRKNFSYYVLIMDAKTKEIVGHLADISSGGFKLDTENPIPANKDFCFLINLPGEIASKPFMVFGAQSRWCQADPLDPCGYNVGYQLTQITPEDLKIINRMIERYGRDYEKKTIDMRHSYKW